ncbi:carboxypeptidase regulatory-like domain-containing protein [Silvibacterium sp.]|uniref:carboxypeptidase regulatory-like domain-containing protein n=1 Tax=Silvibacterium sp. TaxID=1964179 RepID=UPI0039E621DC
MAHAQFRTAIQGTVTDPQGAVVPNARLTLVDKQTNRTVQTTSNASGVYNFNALPASTFTLKVEAQGFESKLVDNLSLIPEQTNNFNVGLTLGSSTTSITVNGDEAAALDTETASVNTTVTSNQIQHMPSFGRDVTQLVQLAPGALSDGSQAAGGGSYSLPGSNMGGSGASDGIFKTENGPQIVANGGQTETNSVLIDGISASSVTWGGSTVVTPTEDSVDSVKVSSNTYDAEFGRFSGAQIQITSKGGSNQVHGSLFFKGDRPGLNAYQSWNGPSSDEPGTAAERGLNRDDSRFNQFGGSVGGPFWKNKLFGFFAYETLRNDTNVTAQEWYETSAYRNSARSGSIAGSYLGYSGEAVNGTLIGGTCAQLGLSSGTQCATIAGQGVDVGSPLTSTLGTHDSTWGGNNSTPGVGNGLDGIADLAYYTTNNPTSSVASQYYGRLDADLSQADRVSFMIYWVPLDTVDYDGPVRSANLWHHDQVNNAFTLLWNHTFSPTLLNEARVNAAGWRWNELASNSTAPWGLTEATFDVPSTDIFPSATPEYFGTPGPSVYDQWTYGYQDILTKVAGRHTLKMGGSLTRLYYLNEAEYNARPTYHFDNIWDFLNDAPYSETGYFSSTTGAPTASRQDNRQDLWAGFVQDDWKVLPTLTLNLGLRYSYFGPFDDKDGNLRSVDLGAGDALVTGLSVRKGGDLYNAQKTNFGPQLGFAWNPEHFNKHVVVRGGFGINFNQNEMAITANGNGNPGNTVNADFCCSTASDPTGGSSGSILYQLPSSLTGSFASFPVNSAAITSYNANGLPSNASTYLSVTGFDANVKTIQTYHYSLDTQTDLGHQWIASIGYQGSESHHLILQQDMNVLAVAKGYSLNPNLTSVDYYGNKGNSNYNALLASLKHNFAHSFQTEAQYTWSKSMDNGSQPYYEDPYPYNERFSWGRSDYNVANAFKLFGMWQPTFFHSHGIAHTLADGWALSGIFNMHTGFPWTPVYSVDNQFYYGSGQTSVRPAAFSSNGARYSTSNKAFKAAPGSANSNFEQGGSSYFTEPSVASGNTGTYGTEYTLPGNPGVARNSFNGPGYKAVDATLSKAFPFPNKVLGEAANFEVRVDAFNVFNNLNLNTADISTTVTSSSFGQAQGALASRKLDIQARFSF